MSARERVMTIRLLERLQAHPAYAKVFGIEICVALPSEVADQKER